MEEGSERCNIAGFGDGERRMDQRICKASSEKGREQILTKSFQEEYYLAHTLILAQICVGFLTFGTVR